MELRKARIQDAKSIQGLINSYAEKGKMLPRSVAEIYSKIQSFFVIEDRGEIVACCSLSIYYPGVGEIISLAVREDKTREGLGTKLALVAIEEARKFGLKELFSFTYAPEFFEKLGFEQIEKNEMHPKFWQECFRCPKYPNCDEVAMKKVL